MTGDSDEILTSVDDGVGFVTLNRPKAINSLTQTMVTAMSRVLTEWEGDDAVRGRCAFRRRRARSVCRRRAPSPAITRNVVAIYRSARAAGVAGGDSGFACAAWLPTTRSTRASTWLASGSRLHGHAVASAISSALSVGLSRDGGRRCHK